MALFTLQKRIVVLGVVLAYGFLPSGASAQGKPGNVIVYLDPMTTANVGGTVNLSPKGQVTNFEVTLNPGEPTDDPSEYKVRVVQGSCSTPGRVVEDLDNVRANGKAKLENGKVRLSEVRGGDHVIQVAGKHEVVACGMIPAR